MKYNEANSPLQCIMTHSTNYQQGSYRTSAPLGLVVHSTGANNPNVSRYMQARSDEPNAQYLNSVIGYNQNANSWNQITNYCGVHGFCGKMADGHVQFVQALPWYMQAWHVGQGWSGYSLNNYYIGIEMCEDGLWDINYAQQVYDEMVEVAAYLSVYFGWDVYGSNYIGGQYIPVITTHYQGYCLGVASGHIDPGNWWGNFGWTIEQFRNDVYACIHAEDNEQEEEELDQNTFNQMMNTYLSELATKPVDDWAKEAMDWAKNEGIYVGDGNSLMPRKFLTREEFAAVLQRVLEEGKGV